MKSNSYIRYMKQAINLAKRAKGSTHPNPMVGCVIVKNDKVIASGFHKKAGGPHAEVIALKKAKDNARGATLFVNLEPCSTYQKTPPCTDEIIKSGIKEVVIAIKDPNPINNSKGIRKLKRHNIKVTLGILKEEARKLNEDFEKFITKKEPFVTVKVAQSLDGKLSTKSGDSKWITSYIARRYVHKLRAYNDAVLVGVNTVIKDNPRLNSRLYKSATKQPKRIIVDSHLRIPYKARMISENLNQNVIIATTKYASQKKVDNLRKRGVDIIITKSKDKLVDLKDLLKKLAEKSIVNLLVEGGSKIITSFLNERLADKIVVFIAPKIIGGRYANTFYEGEGITRIKDALLLKDVSYKRIGEDLMVEGYL